MLKPILLALILGLLLAVLPVQSDRFFTQVGGSNGSGLYSNASNISWYVANAGSDSNNGKTPATAFHTIAHAISVAAVNDTIGLDGGETFSEHLVTSKTLSFRPYGTGTPTIAGGDLPCIQATNCGLNVSGITCTQTFFNLGNAPGGYFGALEVFITDGTAHGEGCNISNCVETGGGYGILFYCAVAGSQCNNTRVTNCDCSGGFFGGISHQVDENTITPRTAFSNFYVAHNVCHDFIGLNFTGSVGAPNPMLVDGADTSIAPCTYEYNLCYNCGATGSTTEVGACYGIFTQNSDGVLVQYNVCHDIHTPNSADGGGWDIDLGSTNVIFQYNYAYNCDGPGFWTEDANGQLSDNNVFRFNVCINCMQNPAVTVNVGYCAFNTIGHTAVYGNTFMGSCALASQPMLGGNAVGATGMFVNKTIYNNLFIGTNSNPCVLIPDATIPASLKMDYNYYQNGNGSFLAKYNNGSNSYSSVGSWSSATGLDAHSQAAASTAILINPTPPNLTPSQLAQLALYFSPVNGSVIAQTGANLSTVPGITPPSIDIVGNSLVAPYCMGALVDSVP